MLDDVDKKKRRINNGLVLSESYKHQIINVKQVKILMDKQKEVNYIHSNRIRRR